MRPRSLSPRAAFPLLWSLSVLWGSGCTSWRAEPTSPATLVATRKPALVRVIRTDSSRVVLREPTVEHDSLFGTEVSNPHQTEGTVRRAIPLTEVAGMQTRRSDPTKNVLLGAGILVGTAASMCFLADELGCGDDAVYAFSALR